jgi:hypothetical protein
MTYCRVSCRTPSFFLDTNLMIIPVVDPLPTPAPVVIGAKLKDVGRQIITLDNDIFNDLVGHELLLSIFS